ncbi:hypothetical protein LTR95_003545 [Oleoguttula sp. CCFEE 5521]
MDVKWDRGRGMRRSRSRELLSKLLPGNKSRTQLYAEDRSSEGAATKRGRSRSAGNRLSQIVHNVSTLDFGGLFAASATDGPVQQRAEPSTAPVLEPIIIAGPSIESNIRHVEAEHPAQWPGAISSGRVQHEPMDTELMQEVRKRRSVIAQAEGSGTMPADVAAALAAVSGLSAIRPRSIAQVLADSEIELTAREPGSVVPADKSLARAMADPVGVLQIRSAGPCNLAFTLQTELSIARREHKAQKNELTSRITGLQSLLGAAYRCNTRAEAKVAELTTAVEKLTARVSAQDSKMDNMQKLLVEAGLVAERNDSKVEMGRKTITRITRKETDEEVVSEPRPDFADVDWTWTHTTSVVKGVRDDNGETVGVAPGERPESANSGDSEATVVEAVNDEPATGEEIKVVHAPVAVPDSNENAAIEKWKQEELELAILGLVYATDDCHPALRV